MKLLSLKLKNFKGIKEFEFAANGENIDIFGENATGKTTVFDALIWLLFDKDSQNRNNFEIKTLDVAGSPIHRLEHEVEGCFLIDGKDVLLRKVYKEKWTRTRGQAIEKFDGHTTDYFLDEVPCKTKREYDTAISKLIDEKVFKLLTNPLFFNENIEWGERREIILKICGDVSESEVIQANDSLADLKKYLKGKSISDLKTMAAAKQSKINAELKMIPVRISELQNSLTEIIVDKEKLQADIASCRQQLEEKNKQILLAENGGTVTQLQLEIKQIDTKIQEALNQLNEATFKRKQEIQSDLNRQEDAKRALNHEIYCNADNVKKLTAEISRMGEAINALRSDYMTNNATAFSGNTGEDSCTCAFCGQSLPEDMLAANRQKAQDELEKFNINKSQKLAEINEKGKALAAEKKLSEEKLEQMKQDAEQLALSMSEVQNTIQKLLDDLSQVGELKTTSPAIEKMKQQQNDLRQKIANDREAQSGIITALTEEKNSIQATITELETDMAAFLQSDKSRQRILELEGDQTTLAREYEELTRQIFLAEEFTKRKVDMLQEKINSKFALARFKMFTENVTNDGIKECCETTLNGVPYKDLNNAAKINIGLDIIRTLAAYYNFEAPIFIDNAEAVTKLIDMGSTQIIRLVVSAPDKALRVESKQTELKEAI